MISAHRLDLSYLIFNFIKATVLEPTEIYYHVDLIGAVFDRVGGLKAFGRCCVISQRKTYHGAYVELALGVIVSKFYIRCRNTD